MQSIIKAKTVVVEVGSERGPALDREEPTGPRVELVRVDGRVVALELSCTCGQAHVVELDYPDEASAAVPAPAPAPTREEAA